VDQLEGTFPASVWGCPLQPEGGSPVGWPYMGGATAGLMMPEILLTSWQLCAPSFNTVDQPYTLVRCYWQSIILMLVFLQSEQKSTDQHQCAF
jgi:hypothetical protein